MGILSIISAIKHFSTQHNVPLDSIVVGGGAALVLYGVRDTATDLNLWISEEHWNRLHQEGGNQFASENRRDPVIQVGDLVWARKLNPYYKTMLFEEVRVYSLIELIIHYRGSYSRCERPQAKRVRDFEAIKFLENLHRQAHAVRADPPKEIYDFSLKNTYPTKLVVPVLDSEPLPADQGEAKGADEFAWDVVVK